MVVAYWYCNLNQGSIIEEAYTAHSATMPAGAVRKTWIIMPRQGVPAQLVQYDLMVSYTPPQMAQWGKNVDQVWMVGVLAEEQATAAEVFQCGESTVYKCNVIRRAN